MIVLPVALFAAAILLHLTRFRFRPGRNRLVLYLSTAAAALVTWAVTVWQHRPGLTQAVLLLAACLAVGGFGALLVWAAQRRTRQAIAVEHQLLRQSRQLQVLHEIGVAMQGTTELPRLLHIILTAITAGYGLGFNRAMLFLISDDERILRGEMGIGSMTAADGLEKWQRVVEDRMKLTDFIANRERVEIQDHDLNDILRGVKLPLSDLSGVVGQALVHRRPIVVRQPEGTDSLQAALRAMFQMGEFAVVPMVNQGKAVGVILVDNNVNRQPIDVDDLGSLMQLATQASLAIDNARLFEEVRRQSDTDGLTGLYNQRYFQRVLAREVGLAAGQERPLSLILLDIDFFKHYNDTHGHLEGNDVLVEIGRTILNHLAPGQIACRFGGEEFALILPGVGEEEGVRIAEHIRQAVAEGRFCPGVRTCGPLTVSLGVAAYRPGMTPTQLLNEADKALYDAKRSGRNRVRVGGVVQ